MFSCIHIQNQLWLCIWFLAAAVGSGSEPAHWAFQPLRNDPPEGSPTDTTPAATTIDGYIRAAWHERGLTRNPRATPRDLLRRLSYDVRGLPPSRDEMEAFLADRRPDAWERWVDQMLASPLYGERWGRHWMDVVRYADTAGDNADYPVPELYRYRDYIIDAFNSDKSFQRFVQEQIAGDLLARSEPQRWEELTIATGFLALSRRYGTMPYELWHLTLEDSIDTMGRAYLGITLKCARCHDHKFDPITTEEYYGLYGIFASTQYPWAGGEELQSKHRSREHFVPLAQGDRLAQARQAHQTAEQAIQMQIASAANPEQKKHYEKQLYDLQRSSLPQGVPGAYAVQEGTASQSAVHLQGDPQITGETIPRGLPRFLPISRPAIPAEESGRLELATWVTDQSNPLFARVIVNRIWQHLFGQGIVVTPSNFGLRGAPPTHPALLDYLALKLIESNYSLKSIQRMILVSDVYQLDCQQPPANMVRDPANQFLWRHERRRLDAEAFRDSLLEASGNLNLGRPGPHPFPSMSDWHWTQHDAFKEEYTSHHRSVYLMTQRLQRHRFLSLFDAPDTNTTTDMRTASTVPSQALYMTNNSWVRQQATALAQQVVTHNSDESLRLGTLYEAILHRQYNHLELERWRGMLGPLRQAAQQATPADPELTTWTSVAHILFCSNEFLYID